MHNSGVSVKQRHSEWLDVKAALSGEFGRRSTPLPLPSSHPCRLSHTQPCEDAEHDHGKQEAGCRERFMWAQLNLWNDNSWPERCGAIKITMCILSLFRGSHVPRFKALAVVSFHYKSFPICFCPQMFWLRHNVLWLRPPKRWNESSEGHVNEHKPRAVSHWCGQK